MLEQEGNAVLDWVGAAMPMTPAQREVLFVMGNHTRMVAGYCNADHGQLMAITTATTIVRRL